MLFRSSKPDKYPIEKRDSSPETLREIPQYRTKTQKYSIITKLKDEVEFGLYSYFKKLKYTKITPPMITPSDCEGAGEVFSLGKDFFGEESFLTVSSQMYLESMTRSFSQVYSLAPAFRADPSLSPRHLAEFWMLEVEMVSDDLSEIIKFSIDLIKEVGSILLQHKDLLSLLDEEIVERIYKKVDQEYTIIDYKDACDLIKVKSILRSEEEKLLLKKVGTPIVLTGFPVDVKPFYMKSKYDKTFSFDVLVPDVGEVVGGSLREESLVTLKKKTSQELQDKMKWYFTLREVDAISTGGFGLGLDRILMYYLEIQSIKDIVTFPRWKEHLGI